MTHAAIDFRTGKDTEIPSEWKSDIAGVLCANYANAYSHHLSPSELKFQRARCSSGALIWNTFRFVGSKEITIPSSWPDACTSMIDEDDYESLMITLAKHEGYLWARDSGEPLGWSNLYSLAYMTHNIYKFGGLSNANVGWVLKLSHYQQPAGSQWGCPFVCYKSSVSMDVTNCRVVRFDLYLNRLIFYLIATNGLSDLLAPLSNSNITESIAERYPCKPVFSTAGVSKEFSFTPGGVLSSNENAGYPAALQPDGIVLSMKDYQLQTLQWMIDQEASPRGLNGCFWEKRSFGDAIDCFYYSPLLGELRLEAPPLVRGGLVCEEMGLGKTLEFIALIMANKKVAPVDSQLSLRVSCASLFVVPDILVSQWETEIFKCIKNKDLKVVSLLKEERNAYRLKNCNDGIVRNEVVKKGSFVEEMTNADIIITSYRTVARAKFFHKYYFQRICLDEMQEVRSSTSQLAQLVQTISAGSRWMISGTPFYTGINDLNGELAFLGLIPFCLSDTKDGFWGHCIETPFRERNPSSLHILRLLLESCMMRHSKAQTYLACPTASILSLPSMVTEHLPVTMTPVEQVCYNYLESMVTRACSVPHFNRIDGLEYIRQFTIAPHLLWLSQTNALDVFFRDVVRLENNSYPIARISSVYFKNALPCDRIRDMFLTRRAENGASRHLSSVASGRGASGKAMRQMSKQRLEDAEKHLEEADKYVVKHVPSLCFKRWKWVLQCVRSGCYHAVLIAKRERALKFPLLFSKAVHLILALRAKKEENSKRRKLNGAGIQKLKMEIDATSLIVNVKKAEVKKLASMVHLLTAALAKDVDASVLEVQGFQALQSMVEQDGTTISCPICIDALTTPVITPCMHIFCSECLKCHIEASSVLSSQKTFACPLCRTKMTAKDIYIVDSIQAEEPLEHGETGETADRVRDEHGWFSSIEYTTAISDLRSFVQENKMDCGSSSYSALNKNFQSAMDLLITDQSSKFKAIISNMQTFIQHDKCVVFSQFKDAIKLFSEALLIAGIGNVETASLKKKDLPVAIDSFQQDPQVRVILIQASHGAAGLTLVNANRVLFLEPFLNRSEEKQAICRVHRMGQKSIVRVSVYHTIDTIEERILAWRNLREKMSTKDVLAIEEDSVDEKRKFKEFVVGLRTSL